MTSLSDAFAAATGHHRAGQLPEAARLYRAILASQPDHVDSLRLLGTVCHKLHQFDEAIACYTRAIALRPDVADFQSQLAAVFLAVGNLDSAYECCQRAVQLAPQHAEAHLTLGNVRQMQGRLDEAIEHYRGALVARPNFPDAHNNLGLALKTQGHTDAALAAFRTAVELEPNYAGGYVNIANILRAREQLDEAIACCEQAIRIAPQFVMAIVNLAEFYHTVGRLADAQASYRQALALHPSGAIRFTLAMLLPVVYASTDEIERYRRQIVEELTAMVEAGYQLDPINEKLPPQFLLAYQGQNDRDIQRLCARLCQASSQNLAGPRGAQKSADGRIHVGLISSFFKDHTIGLLNRGLVENLSRERFSVTVLSLASAQDAVARQIRAAADRAIELPKDLAAARTQIAALDLDVLLYTDIGMDLSAFALAVSRLAPVQCVTWGHPVTTGLPTIDYFLSSQLMEPPGASAHYSEQLACLPRLGTCYERPVRQAETKTREHFGLSPAKHLYFCPQTLFKFHPDFDAVLGEILRRDPLGEIVLIEGRYPHWTELLRERLRGSIGQSLDRVRFVPSMSRPDLLDLMAACDVMLDTLHFGGGNTTYEALSVGTPVVTLPGQFMRGRITYGCYQQMQVLDCVAADAAEYVEIAVRLASDRAWRGTISDKILARVDLLFGDLEAIRQTEQFLEQAVRNAAPR